MEMILERSAYGNKPREIQSGKKIKRYLTNSKSIKFNKRSLSNSVNKDLINSRSRSVCKPFQEED